MKIVATDLQMQARSSLATSFKSEEKFKLWVDPQNREKPLPAPATASKPTNNVELSEAGRRIQSQENELISRIDQMEEEIKNDPRMQLILYIVELFTGKKITTLDTEELSNSEASTVLSTTNQAALQASPENTPTPARQGWGVEYTQSSTYTETQITQFQASGTIRTADQREIQFDLSFTLQRSLSIESTTQIQLGDAKKIDPLLLNFSGQSAQLTSQKFAFDLNADGQNESISFVKGAGFLVFDKNADGKVNNGSELFGPASGNGFAELAQFDSDANNWIDENDAIYQQLSVWTKDSDGKDLLQNLKQANVGALFLGNISTPFDLNNSSGKTDGLLQASGMWLSEDGRANLLQQVDLMV